MPVFLTCPIEIFKYIISKASNKKVKYKCLGETVILHQTTPAEEKSYLEDVARRLEEELLLVKERIEKLRSVA